MISVTGVIIAGSIIMTATAILVWLKKSSDMLAKISRDVEILQKKCDDNK